MRSINGAVLRSAFAMVLGFVLVLWPDISVAKIVDKRAHLQVYLSSSALSACLRVIKMKVNKQQNWGVGSL